MEVTRHLRHEIPGEIDMMEFTRRRATSAWYWGLGGNPQSTM